VRHGAVATGIPVVIHQGIEVHRPSRIEVRATLQDGAVTDVFVGGRTISVATGQFTFL
jgi:trans-2,3-dihydro-3-hydroxyanthranilate isomerase